MQFARPKSDIVNGGWSALGSTIPDNFWRLICEPVPTDSIGIRTGNNPSAIEFEAGLTVIGAPADSSDLTLRYRYLATNSGMDLTIRVLDGTTQVATFTHTTSPTSATEFTLSVPFSGITNWDDLRVELTADGPGSCRVFNVRLEGANDTGPGIVTELRALTPWALYRFREAAGAAINDELANAHLAPSSGQSGGWASRPTFNQTTMLPDGSDTSVAFDGIDDEVESPGFTSHNGNGTIVLLVKAGVLAGRASNETIFRSQSAGLAGLIALQWGALGQYVLHWRNDAGSGNFTDLWTPLENDIDLIFIVTDGTDLRVYRNDSTVAEFTTTAQTAQGHDEIGVGANKTSDAFAEFDIQTLAVYRSALTETNRLDIYAAFAGAGGTPVTNSVSLLWDVLDEISDSVSLVWDVLEEVSDSVSLQWDVFTIVVDSFAAEWDVHAVITDAVDLQWDVLDEVADEVNFQWDVFTEISDEVELTWDVFTQVSDEVDLVWDVRAQITDSTSLLWDVDAQVSDSVDLVWDVEGLGQVTSTTVLRWDVLDQVEDSVSLLWDVGETVTDSVQLQWDVGETITDSVSLLWDVESIGGVENSVQFLWDVQEIVTDSVSLLWGVGGTITNSLSLLWDVLDQISDQVELTWDVFIPASNSVSLLWDLEGRITNTVSLLWDVEPTDAIDTVSGGRTYTDTGRKYSDTGRTYNVGTRQFRS